jgi:hypothetical protein
MIENQCLHENAACNYLIYDLLSSTTQIEMYQSIYYQEVCR